MDEMETGRLKQRVLELEKQKEKLVQSCEAAVKELSARNEERKQFQLQLDSMTTELAKSQMKLEQANLELEQFQDKSDKKIYDKNEQLLKQQAVLEARDSEIQMLQQQLGSRAPGGRKETGHLQQRVLELEKKERQLVESCEAAVKELSARNEERKLFQVQLDSITTELKRLQSECRITASASEELAKSQRKLEQANLELEQFQDKSDKKIYDKNEQLLKQQAVLEARDSEIRELQQQLARVKKEKYELQRTVDHLEGKPIRELRAPVKREGDTRTCPVCETKLSGQMDQAEFERHVQSHFN